MQRPIAVQLAQFSNQNMLSRPGGVHSSVRGTTMHWRNKPLLRRDGDTRFKTGAEAANLLYEEAKRRDGNLPKFLCTFQSTLRSIAPLFDRNPKYAWIAKQLIEPERMVQFRVAWLDDTGVSRMNRGYRMQYSSTLGPYHGSLNFNARVDSDFIKSQGFDAVLTNSISGLDIGAASGGADFNPKNKSDAEIQRFSQSFMTELSKYIGPDIDLPGPGLGVSATEIGYMYGQYKRINSSVAGRGTGILWGGQMKWKAAPGFGVVYFAQAMLNDKSDSLEGKRCVVTGSGMMAMSVAKKLCELGATVLTLSDSSGYIYEQDGLDLSRLDTINKIKAERGARLGRYLMSSTTAKYDEPSEIFNVPCDLVFPCSGSEYAIDEKVANKLADNNCMGVIEGGHMPSTPEAILAYKQRGMLHGPYKASLAAGGPIVNGAQMSVHEFANKEELDERLEAAAQRTFAKVKRTAMEFNARGDLHAGANMAGFLKVADVMSAHGAV
uniref:Glutamate dehydrogenase n=1 Tax=Octactis speculum TaxID=3111310 RepID=A0A7S2E2V9_9STRA